MCCFSPVSAPVGFFARLFARPQKVHVAATRIFARAIGREQALVYSMRLSVAGEVAMILPIPVVPGSGESALTFVDLSGYPKLFEDMARAFEVDMMPLARGGFGYAPQGRPKLVVYEVGAFVASYVPTRGDFDRLDERFRLPQSVWAAMKTYDDWGFAVFQLAPGKDKQIHPMALRFATRDPARLYFPTVHVHDGQFHDTAEFDHELYWQHPALDQAQPFGPDMIAMSSASSVVRIADTAGLVDGEQRLARRSLHGELPNADVWIAPPRRDTAAA